MHSKKYGFVPSLSSQSGSCLTTQNWQDASVSAICYSLQQLLIKPGEAVLRTFPNLSSFLGWSGAMILDARMTAVCKDGQFKLQSPFDGSKLIITAQELVDLISHLAPDYVIFPDGFQKLMLDIWQQLPEKICPVISPGDRGDFPERRELVLQFSQEQSHLRGIYNQYPYSYSCDSDLLFNDKAMQRDALFILSDRPLNDAFQGLVYTREGKVDLTQKAQSKQFEKIDSQCTCPVCEQALTRAYLHHLLQHTPLLCHRFLIQHNVYIIQKDFL